MSSSTTSTAPNGQPTQGLWSSLAPYAAPPLAAASAIIFPFRDFIAKSDQQLGRPVQKLSVREGLRKGLAVSPTTGGIVGTQMVAQHFVEKALFGDSDKQTLSSKLKSAGIVGVLSAPFLAVFNGRGAGLGLTESLRRFNPKIALALAVQETAFVGGVSAAGPVAVAMKEKLGNNKAVEYAAAFKAGAIGSLVGHAANTAVTRWQMGMKVDNARQLMWGAARKARGVGLFSVGYKLVNELIGENKSNSGVKKST